MKPVAPGARLRLMEATLGDHPLAAGKEHSRTLPSRRERAYARPMRIAVIGTGHAGRTLAQGIQRVGHEVVVGTRDPDATRAREEWLGIDLPLAALGVVAA